MFKLPANKPQVPVDTPRNFFFYGATMSGKSYLANEFPNPIILNTDGNASANSVPAIQLVNEKDQSGRITKSVIEQLSEILLALQTQKHTYETVVVDVIDDVIDMIKIAVCGHFGVKALSEVPYGKASDYFNQALTELVIDLKSLPVNVIYISREVSIYDEKGKVIEKVPSLKEKYVNLINGNSDLMIRTEKLGNNYNREVVRKRKTYKSDQIDDKEILKILQTIDGAVVMTSKTTKTKPAEKKQEVAAEEDIF
ncbi:AAA family ATPase [Streptococcus suis]|nr:AAA family ATPase [Streptococcus suis]